METIFTSVAILEKDGAFASMRLDYVPSVSRWIGGTHDSRKLGAEATTHHCFDTGDAAKKHFADKIAESVDNGWRVVWRGIPLAG